LFRFRQNNRRRQTTAIRSGPISKENARSACWNALSLCVNNQRGLAA
jgi:hypothetical protein